MDTPLPVPDPAPEPVLRVVWPDGARSARQKNLPFADYPVVSAEAGPLGRFEAPIPEGVEGGQLVIEFWPDDQAEHLGSVAGLATLRLHVVFLPR